MKKRVIYFDILNIIAIIAVIGMHCNGIVHGNPTTRSWATSLIVECLCYFAVPLFCTLSGANLMNYREKYNTRTFFKKRVFKVLVPFLFWAIIMFIWKMVVIKTMQPYDSVLEFINSFFSNKEETTYYFMFCILGIYLTMPLLSLLAKKENKKSLWFIVLLYFVFNSLIPNITVLFGIRYNMDVSVLFSGYIIFVILGYLLKNTDIKKTYRVFIYIGAVIGLIYRYLTTFILSRNAGYVVKTTWSYTSWYSILLVASIFLIIKYLDFDKKLSNNTKITTALVKISSCSFGIYLIHQIVMYYEKIIFSINTASWSWRTIGIITTYIISLLIVLLLKKIPVIKKLVP